uniref:Putative secreted protein n=1 Tax=Panstrongylus lignarius TaxID=156445 RepID=A0A224Y787_9HEMI
MEPLGPFFRFLSGFLFLISSEGCWSILDCSDAGAANSSSFSRNSSIVLRETDVIRVNSTSAGIISSI